MSDVAAWLRWLCVWGLALTFAVASEDSASAQGKKYAVVIGVSYCEDPSAAALPFVENDVEILAKTLAERGFDVYPFCEASVKFDLDPKYKKKIKPSQLPTKANIERAFTDWDAGPLKKVFDTKNATLLVVFSGHGVITSDVNEKTWLFLRDSTYKSKNGAINTRSMLGAQALREMMSAAKCERRLLLLDSCHAAGTRSAATTGKEVAYYDLFAQSFREGGVDGVTTFASCSFRSVSGVVAPHATHFSKSQKKFYVSAFTYWVNEALKGRADGCVDGKPDGVVGSDELFAYVERNFRWIRSAGRYSQTPAIVAAKDAKPFDLCAVLSRGYGETIDDLAEQIVAKAFILGKKEIYIEDFAETFASAELRENQNEVDALHSFAVSTVEQLRESVDKKWKALNSGAIIRRDGLAADRRLVVKGVVEAMSAKKEIAYAISCKMRSANQSTAQNLENANASAKIAAKDAPEGALKGFDDGTSATAVPMNVRVEARGANESAWRERPIREIDGVQWLELNPGETYRVVFEPNADARFDEEFAATRLLIDGRNSLAQYEPRVTPPNDFGWQLEEASQDEEASQENVVAFDETEREETEPDKPQIVVAPVVPLDRANFWLLNPRKKYVIDGFCDQFSQTSDAFRVVKADDETVVDAPAEDERGLIVVAFYKAARSRGSLSDVMTVPGPKRRYSTIVVKGFEPSAPLGILRLRYASAEYLDRLEAESAPLVGGLDE